MHRELRRRGAERRQHSRREPTCVLSVCASTFTRGRGQVSQQGIATGKEEREFTRQRGKEVQEESERWSRPTCSLKEPEARQWRQREDEEGASVGRHRRGLEQERGRTKCGLLTYDFR